MKVRKLIKLFLKHTEQNRKPNTLRHYRGRLKPFKALIGTTRIDAITLADIEEALNTANRWGDGSLKAPDTRRSNAVVLQQMFRFAVRRGYLEAMPFEKLERPSGRRRERIPTDDENRAIEAAAGPEFRAIFRALRQTGARPGELAGVLIENYDAATRLITISDHKTATKTGRPRKIGVGEKLERMLKQAIADRESGPIFLDPQGRQWTSARLSAEYRRLRDAAGLPKDLCLYLQRHQHATVLCEKVGIHAAAHALGHASVQTTQRYVHPDDAQLSINQDLV